MSAPLAVMWGGVAVAFLGFTSLWTGPAWPFEVLKEDLFEAIGRWLVRAGLAAAFVGAAAHLALG